MRMDVSSSRPSNKANIFLGLIEYELNSLLGASHLVDYISVHIRFNLERYLLNIRSCSAHQRKILFNVASFWFHIVTLKAYILKLDSI